MVQSSPRFAIEDISASTAKEKPSDAAVQVEELGHKMGSSDTCCSIVK